MLTTLTKTQAEELKKNTAKENTYYVGELYPTIFDHYKGMEFKEGMTGKFVLMHVGAFEADTSIFPKRKCPVCGKEEVLIPYACVASVLSGCHTINFYCTNCHEHVAQNDIIDYYHIIRDYIQENRHFLKRLQRQPVFTPITQQTFISNINNRKD